MQPTDPAAIIFKLLDAVSQVWGLNPIPPLTTMQGLPLEWSEGDVWTASVDLPPSSVEFKVGGRARAGGREGDPG